MKTTILTVGLVLISKSTLHGQWTHLPNLSQDVIAVHVSGRNIIAGTKAGIHYTSDSGKTWKQSTGISSTANSFAQDSNKLLVSSYEQLYKSTDDGASWSSLPAIYSFEDVNNLVIAGTKYIVGMNGSGVWYSADKGSSWWSSSSSWQGRNTCIARKKNQLFATYQGSGYLQASFNDGQTWYAPQGNGLKIGPSSSFQDIYCIAVKDDSILIAGTKNTGTYTIHDGVYFSYDDGNNWIKRNNGITTPAINSIAVLGHVIFVGTNGGGVFYSKDDGDKWIALNDGLSNLTINKLYIHGSTLYAGVSTGVFSVDVCGLLKNTCNLKAVGSATILSGDSVELFASCKGFTYQWFLNDALIKDSQGNTFFAKSGGSYKAVVTYASDCRDTTNAVPVVVNSMTGKNEFLLLRGALKLYPNPSDGTVTFVCTIPKSYEPFELRIYSADGSMVRNLPLLNSFAEITMADWQAGIYYALIQNKTSITQTQKFVVIK
jgi:photosystem II stability/assembly factor-like uncharacterized protein